MFNSILSVITVLIIHVLCVAFGDEEVVDIHHSSALFHPQLAKVAAVFAFAVFDGLQQDLLAQNFAPQKIARRTPTPLAARAQFRRVNAMQADLLFVQRDG